MPIPTTASMLMRCYFPAWQNTIERSPKTNYLVAPQTIGKHLLKRRLDLRILKKDVAKLLGVSEACITLWENEQSEPQVRYAPGIIRFLEFNPYFSEGDSFAVKIKNHRIKQGFSHKKMGRVFEVDATTIKDVTSIIPIIKNVRPRVGHI